uniref:Uncharacterized protein n=1 Tax=Trypanosoma congolense (strain IL3000) TaxID=1068625 RepID=G0UZ26_TRYCI|nr:conserved hypothetical protein [Trypanosoma congolense IL3000]
MLVAVREFLPDETRRLCGSQDESLEVRYTINIKDNELTITDAADPRCCQILKCDFYFSTSGLLFDSAVAPIVRLALQDFGSAKAIVVVDGAETVRHHTLFDPIEGILARSWRLLVDWAVGLCGVTLENIFLNIVELRGNTMLKDLSLGGTRHGFKGKGVIARELWDSHSAGDLLASLECAPYYDVKCEGDLRMALHRVSHVVSSDYSQVFSLVLQYRTPTQRYSTTLRFMSLAMADEERAGPSTRHCVVTAAQLISCCALNKAGVSTAFSSLVEPGLLGQCPALWISCFAPSAPTFAAFPGSFTESYRVATTASHVYESRRGVRGHRSSQQVASFPSSRKKKTMNSTSNLYSEVDATHCVKKKHSARASSRARQTESRNSCHAEAKISDCATKTCAGFFSQTVYNCAGPEAAPGVRAGEAANGSHPTVQPGKGSGGCDNGGTSHAPCHRRTKARPQCPFEANQRAMWLQLFNHLQRELNRYEKREDAYRHCIEVLKWALSSFETGTTGPKGEGVGASSKDIVRGARTCGGNVCTLLGCRVFQEHRSASERDSRNKNVVCS